MSNLAYLVEDTQEGECIRTPLLNPIRRLAMRGSHRSFKQVDQDAVSYIDLKRAAEKLHTEMTPAQRRFAAKLRWMSGRSWDRPTNIARCAR